MTTPTTLEDLPDTAPCALIVGSQTHALTIGELRERLGVLHGRHGWGILEVDPVSTVRFVCNTKSRPRRARCRWSLTASRGPAEPPGDFFCPHSRPHLGGFSTYTHYEGFRTGVSPWSVGPLQTSSEDPPCWNRRQGSGESSRTNPGHVQPDNLGRGSAATANAGQHGICPNGALCKYHARPPSKLAIPGLSTCREDRPPEFLPAVVDTTQVADIDASTPGRVLPSP